MKRIYRSSRIEFAAALINEIDSESVTIADIGCRDQALRSRVKSSHEYSGFDIYPVHPETTYGDIEAGIKTDKTFDFVVALDVLEHTNNIEKSTQELLRICERRFIINLPNELWILYRWRMMFGRISGKFRLDFTTTDRHRWFFTLDNVTRYMESGLFEDWNVNLVAFYQKSRFIGPVCWFLGLFGLNSVGAISFMLIGSKRP
jgi:hypothetical protein